MKRLTLLFVSILCFACLMGIAGMTAAAANSSTEQVITLLKSKKKIPIYAEVNSVVYNPNFHTQTKSLITYWDNTVNGLYRDQMHQENGNVHFSLSKGGKTISYAQGDSRAIVANAPTTFAAVIDTQFNLNHLLATTNVTFKGEENVNNRITYHLAGKGKEIPEWQPPTNAPKEVIERWKLLKQPNQPKRFFPDIEFWFDKQTGIVIKKKTNDEEINVTKMDPAPKFTDATFNIPLPNGVKMVNIDDVIKEEQAKQ